MDILHAIFLALLQGLTEFLPVSSSAHLILLPHVMGWVDQGLAFDVAVHVGTLLAVILYFRQRIIEIFNAWWLHCAQRQYSNDARLGWGIILASIPLGLVGLLLGDWLEQTLRNPMVIAMASAGFAVLLWLADRLGRRSSDSSGLLIIHYVFIGVAQVFALIPGASRSGVTMTVGLALGLTRRSAAEVSFLLAIPAILMSGGYKLFGLFTTGVAVAWTPLLIAVTVSAVFAWLTIRLFLTLVERIGMLPFVCYRLILAAVILMLFI